MKLGIRSDLHWDGTTALFLHPQDWINQVKGVLNLLYVDVPWVKELFINFDSQNLTAPLWKGNWGYAYTFGDYVNFFRAIHAAGIEVVFAIQGIGSNAKANLNFVANYPNSTVDGKWVNPDYVDPTWNGMTFLEMYAQKIHAFASYIGMPITVSFEDWRYPGYMIGHPQIIRFRNKLKSLSSTHQVWGPPASMGSARDADYNSFYPDHPWCWEYPNDTEAAGASDILLSNVATSYHSAMNVAGWLGAQMCYLPQQTKLVEKPYWGFGSGYDVPSMKKKLRDIIFASYLTRIIGVQGETCPVGGFIVVYKPPPVASLQDLLEVLSYAGDFEFLKDCRVDTPILKVPHNLGPTAYPDNLNPLSGYMNGEGLKPMRFVHESLVGYVKPTDMVVTHSGKDYSADAGLSFNAPLNCTWLVRFNTGQEYNMIFHDGGYESGTYDAQGALVPSDITSYKQPETVVLNQKNLPIAADSALIFDEAGNLVANPVSTQNPTPIIPIIPLIVGGMLFILGGAYIIKNMHSLRICIREG